MSSFSRLNHFISAFREWSWGLCSIQWNIALMGSTTLSHGLCLLVLKWVCNSVDPILKRYFHGFLWCFWCSKTIFSIHCQLLVSQSLALCVLLSHHWSWKFMGLHYWDNLYWTDGDGVFWEASRAMYFDPSDIHNDMQWNWCLGYFGRWVGVFSVGNSTVLLEGMRIRRLEIVLCCIFWERERGNDKKPARWMKVHISQLGK